MLRVHVHQVIQQKQNMRKQGLLNPTISQNLTDSDQNLRQISLAQLTLFLFWLFVQDLRDNLELLLILFNIFGFLVIQRKHFVKWILKNGFFGFCRECTHGLVYYFSVLPQTIDAHLIIQKSCLEMLDIQTVIGHYDCSAWTRSGLSGKPGLPSLLARNLPGRIAPNEFIHGSI